MVIGNGTRMKFYLTPSKLSNLKKDKPINNVYLSFESSNITFDKFLKACKLPLEEYSRRYYEGFGALYLSF